MKEGRRLPWWYRIRESAIQCRGHGFGPSSGRISHAVEQLSLSTATTEPMSLDYCSPCVLELCCAAREPTGMRGLCAATREQSPLATAREKALMATKTQHSQKRTQLIKKFFLSYMTSTSYYISCASVSLSVRQK